jgi:hypothetical protein
MFRECRHIMPSGARCHSPALREKPYCFYHMKLHRLEVEETAPQSSKNRKKRDTPLEITTVEDPGAVQLALTRVLDAIASERLDPRRAGQLLYGLQIAASLAMRHQQFAAYDAEQIVSYDDNGQPLAPESNACETPEECSKCTPGNPCPDHLLLKILQKGIA